MPASSVDCNTRPAQVIRCGVKPNQRTNPIRVYLDIDGTILFEPGNETAREELDNQLVCDGLASFLEFVVAHCDPQWLSYRTRLGNLKLLEERLFPHLPKIARRIPAAGWNEFKHEAIDPKSPFLWFDDDAEPEDIAWLTDFGCLNSLVRMDPTNRQNPSIMLQEIKVRLEQATRL